ncbi:MAG TPA: M15 family metallopeptidase [Candidatus Paceibacterota bacterium]
MTVENALADHPDRPAPSHIRQQLRLLTIEHLSYDNKIHRGQIVVNKRIADQVTWAFSDMLKEQIPITKMVPISAYRWDDEASMQDNNCSAYNFRLIAGKNTISLHAMGLALDIDPLFNPWMKGDQVQPAGATYDPSRPGTLTENSRTVRIFKSHGFYWGGDWFNDRGYIDLQHFDVNPYGNSEQIIDDLRREGVIPL